MEVRKQVCKERGFSLIEILVVCVIVAALSVLLMPTFKKMLARSLLMKCMGNQHQLHVAWAQYAQENNGSMLPAVDEPTRDWYARMWDLGYSPGANEKSTRTIYQCPANPNRIGFAWNRPNYSYNLVMGVYDGTGKTWPYPRQYLASATKASRIVILADGSFWASNSNPSGPPGVVSVTMNAGILANANGTDKPQGVGYTWHEGKANFLFVDGHVETLTPAEVQERYDNGLITTSIQ